MRCHICDRVLDEPKFNADTDAYEPCEPCMIVILDALEGFKDQPFLTEDELAPDPSLTSYWEAVLALNSHQEENE
jgi:hypothetical protein